MLRVVVKGAGGRLALPSGKQIEDVLLEMRCRWYVEEKGNPRSDQGKSEVGEEDEGGDDDDSKLSTRTTTPPAVRIPVAGLRWLPLVSHA